jgi:hypothetical protein
MELIPGKLVTIHLVDENFLFADDIREKYIKNNKYQVKVYPSTESFFRSVKEKASLFKKGQIVIFAVKLEKADKKITSDLINKTVSLMPDVDIINICHEKELEKGTSFIRNGRIIHIINNENALYRIENAIKWVLAKTNLENKQKLFKAVLWIMIVSLIITTAIIFLHLFVS